MLTEMHTPTIDPSLMGVDPSFQGLGVPASVEVQAHTMNQQVAEVTNLEALYAAPAYGETDEVAAFNERWHHAGATAVMGEVHIDPSLLGSDDLNLNTSVTTLQYDELIKSKNIFSQNAFIPDQAAVAEFAAFQQRGATEALKSFTDSLRDDEEDKAA